MRVAHKTKNNKKSLPEPVGQSFPQIWRLNPVLELVGLGFGKVWDTLWCLLDGFGAWDLLGRSWAPNGSLRLHGSLTDQMGLIDPMQTLDPSRPLDALDP